MTLLEWLWKIVLQCRQWLSFQWFRFLNTPSFRRKSFCELEPVYRNAPKPPWVRKEIIRLKALMPKMGYRKIADTFNRCFSSTQNMTVGKTWVSDVIRQHQYEIQALRKKIKNSQPKPIPKNLVWGMDITCKVDQQEMGHAILGLVESHSRASLFLKAIVTKSSWHLLYCLWETIQRYGKPKIIRTDNEPIFTSRLFRATLFLLGIQHQRIDKGCPWQNGRVERFFGTLKEKLDQLSLDHRNGLNQALRQFSFWYNQVRSHQNLSGRTPAEVWRGINVYQVKPKREYWFEAWDGLLTGIYLKL